MPYKDKISKHSNRWSNRQWLLGFLSNSLFSRTLSSSQPFHRLKSSSAAARDCLSQFPNSGESAAPSVLHTTTTLAPSTHPMLTPWARLFPSQVHSKNGACLRNDAARPTTSFTKRSEIESLLRFPINRNPPPPKDRRVALLLMGRLAFKTWLARSLLLGRVSLTTKEANTLRLLALTRSDTSKRKKLGKTQLPNWNASILLGRWKTFLGGSLVRRNQTKFPRRINAVPVLHRQFAPLILSALRALLPPSWLPITSSNQLPSVTWNLSILTLQCRMGAWVSLIIPSRKSKSSRLNVSHVN